MSEKREVIFTEGFIFKKPGDKAPEFVKGEIAIKVDEFVAFLLKHKKPDGWINLNLKKSAGGKLYTDLNTWTPPKKDNATALPEFPEEDINPEDIPF